MSDSTKWMAKAGGSGAVFETCQEHLHRLVHSTAISLKLLPITHGVSSASCQLTNRRFSSANAIKLRHSFRIIAVSSPWRVLFCAGFPVRHKLPSPEWHYKHSVRTEIIRLSWEK